MHGPGLGWLHDSLLCMDQDWGGYMTHCYVWTMTIVATWFTVWTRTRVATWFTAMYGPGL